MEYFLLLTYLDPSHSSELSRLHISCWLSRSTPYLPFALQGALYELYQTGMWTLWLLIGWANKGWLMWGQGISFPPSTLWGHIICHCKVSAPVSGLLYNRFSPFHCLWPLPLPIPLALGRSYLHCCYPWVPLLALFLHPFHPACSIVINALQRNPPNLSVPSFPGGSLTCIPHFYFPGIIPFSCFETPVGLLKPGTHLTMFSVLIKNI